MNFSDVIFSDIPSKGTHVMIVGLKKNDELNSHLGVVTNDKYKNTGNKRVVVKILTGDLKNQKRRVPIKNLVRSQPFGFGSGTRFGSVGLGSGRDSSRFGRESSSGFGRATRSDLSGFLFGATEEARNEPASEEAKNEPATEEAKNDSLKEDVECESESNGKEAQLLNKIIELENKFDNLMTKLTLYSTLVNTFYVWMFGLVLAFMCFKIVN